MELNQLMSVLENEEEKLKELIEVLKTKKEAIKSGEVDSIESALKDERNSLNAIDRMEKERILLTERIAGALETAPTISGIISKTEEPQKHDMAVMAAKLTEHLSEVNYLNMGIQQLIAYKLEEFDIIMDSLRNDDITYGNDKAGNPNSTGLMFNGRA